LAYVHSICGTAFFNHPLAQKYKKVELGLEAQVVQCLPGKSKVLSSNPQYLQNEKVELFFIS
jgi:hypothetical protein